MENKIKLSIITISLKYDENLIKTLNSIDKDFETDCKSNLIENIVVVSENIKEMNGTSWRKFYYTPAKGVYNAMNKGLNESSGKFVWFLNAGDISFNNRNLINLIEHVEDDIIMAGVNSISNDEKSKVIFGKYTSPHQGTIYKTEVLKKINGFREDFKVVSDRIAFDELSIKGASKLRLKKVIADFYEDGISSGIDGKILNKKESLKYYLEKPYSFRRLYRYVKQF